MNLESSGFHDYLPYHQTLCTLTFPKIIFQKFSFQQENFVKVQFEVQLHLSNKNVKVHLSTKFCIIFIYTV